MMEFWKAGRCHVVRAFQGKVCLRTRQQGLGELDVDQEQSGLSRFFGFVLPAQSEGASECIGPVPVDNPDLSTGSSENKSFIACALRPYVGLVCGMSATMLSFES